MTVGLTHPPTDRRKSVCTQNDRRGSEQYARCFQNYYHGQRFLSADPHYIAHVRLTINHWQIRDLVQVDAHTGSVFHTEDENIRILSARSPAAGSLRSRTHLSLPYRPRCFHHATGGLVVAGGVLTTSAKVYQMDISDLTSGSCGGERRHPAKGLFSVYSPAMGSEMSFLLGDMINNAVRIYPQQNSLSAYTAYACNNDSGLYKVDISDSGVCLERMITCDRNTSLNNVHSSADGRVVTVTGDTGTIFLVDPASPRAVRDKISTSHDSGFGISYHSNGHLFAVAFQNGTCTVFDSRNTTSPVHEAESTRPGHQSGAFRTCRFINSPVQDLLAVSEHLGRVHLFDVRDFAAENRQVIVYPFAVDQYARGRTTMEQLDDEFSTDMHRTVEVFDDPAPFTAPLVYDYAYLTDVNPKLFKGFTYMPATEAREVKDVGVAMECEPSLGTDVAADGRISSRAQESYSQSLNHVNGEMEIAGMDWYGNRLFVGSEDGGMLVWDVNARARRSCGSFSFV
ncbi:hypothetical protein OXX79_008704 [Metschnikowia pulcherrima]